MGKSRVSIFIPPQASKSNVVPILYFLSGLTCNEDNFITKSGATQYASKYGVGLICPDTSPRGVQIKGDDEHWDFGTGAGFYIDATQKPWSPYYSMYSYIVKELPKTLKSIDRFKEIFDFENASIFGHSMGGHGALMIYLRNLSDFKSCSVFAPVTNPMITKWGIKSFTNYLGKNENDWKQYDSSELVRSLSDEKKKKVNVIMIDQGTNDFALSHGDDKHDQLRTKQFEQICKENGIATNVRYQDGYGHGYDFIATFVADHIQFHSKYLLKDKQDNKKLVDKVDAIIDYAQGSK